MKQNYYSSLVNWASFMIAAAGAGAALFIVAVVFCEKSTNYTSSWRDLQPPKLFNFDEYKSLYDKQYHSSTEELVRRKLMLARALRAFISGSVYRLGDETSFLALNHLSDKTDFELSSRLNKHLGDLAIKQTKRKHDDQHVKQPAAASLTSGQSNDNNNSPGGVGIPEFDPMKIESYLDNLISDNYKPELARTQSNLDWKQIRDELRHYVSVNQRVRRVRDTSSNGQDTATSPLKTTARAFPIYRLINSPNRLSNMPSKLLADKIELNPPSNNPYYQAPEFFSYGLRNDSISEVYWSRLVAVDKTLNNRLHKSRENFNNNNPPTGSEKSLYKFNLNERKKLMYKRRQNSPAVKTEAFINHASQNNCLLMPRDQEECGSCYSYASIALLEWLHCMRRGKLIAFSEQYIIDCGRSVGSSGCDGSPIEYVSKFVHNYGLELRVNYRPQKFEDTCPYDEETDPKTMGFIRMDLRDSVQIKEENYADYLRVTPIIISLHTNGTDFSEYGGGVYLGSSCRYDSEGDHVVLLVGHGQQDGYDYWLIRNSYSVAWGEGGYMKLWKGSACIQPDYGYVFGTQDASNWPVPEKNDAHSVSLIRKNYARKLQRDLAERFNLVGT